MWLDNFNDENFDNKIQYQVRVYICTLQSTPLNNTTWVVKAEVAFLYLTF